MALQASYTKRVFHFNFQARTSRGSMEEKSSWFIKIWNDLEPQMIGIGECGPLPGLSPEASPGFESVLEEVIARILENKQTLVENFNTTSLQHFTEIVPSGFPSITFGLETALLDLMHGGKRVIFENGFIAGQGIPINGLIWMGDPDFMVSQIDQKIAQGYRCIKLKVGSLDFNQECRILHYIRSRYGDQALTIRLDANGAFQIGDALTKLKELKRFDIHSIEQPIKKGLAEMERLCAESPIPIAFDEELIGYESSLDKRSLLEILKPQFITLKPTLHGGFSGCQSWIEIAKELGIGWWLTSALESNIGLNAICQFAANFKLEIPQGLGTGAIYKNNIESSLNVQNGTIFLDTGRKQVPVSWVDSQR